MYGRFCERINRARTTHFRGRFLPFFLLPRNLLNLEVFHIFFYLPNEDTFSTQRNVLKDFIVLAIHSCDSNRHPTPIPTTDKSLLSRHLFTAISCLIVKKRNIQ